MTEKCAKVGNANPDIAGIGILLSFGIQAFIAIVISVYSSVLEASILKYKILRYVPTSRKEYYETRKKKQEIANKILLQGSDVQSMTGVALLISAIARIDSLPFYHLHIVYDTISFVAISVAAAAVCCFNPTMKRKALRLSLISLWAILYLTYTSLFGVRLRSWNYDIEGRCYNSDKLAKPNASHPYVDNIYVSITCVWVFLSLSWSLLMITDPSGSETKDMKDRAATHNIILGIAALQFPLHVYSIFTLRSLNESLLISGSAEQEWGFGQIVAVILLGTNLVTLVNGFQDYRQWKKSQAEVKTNESPPVTSTTEMTQMSGGQDV